MPFRRKYFKQTLVTRVEKETTFQLSIVFDTTRISVIFYVSAEKENVLK